MALVAADSGRPRTRPPSWPSSRASRSRARCPRPTSASCARATALRQTVRAGALSSAHDVAEGGVAIAIAEACIAGGIGARVDLAGIEPFAEGPGAFVVSAPAEALTPLGGAAQIIGEVGGDALELAGERPLPVEELTRVHADGLAALLA